MIRRPRHPINRHGPMSRVVYCFAHRVSSAAVSRGVPMVTLRISALRPTGEENSSLLPFFLVWVLDKRLPRGYHFYRSLPSK
jgi:hypothetical protein